MRHIGPDRGDGKPDRRLAVADYPDDRDPDRSERVGDLAQQAGKVVGRRGQQRPSQQDQPGQAVADDPQHLVAHIGLKPVNRQDGPALALQGFAVSRRAGRGGDQLVVAVEQVGYGPLGDRPSRLGAGKSVRSHAGALGGGN